MDTSIPKIEVYKAMTNEEIANSIPTEEDKLESAREKYKEYLKEKKNNKIGG
jgi:DNA polymerase IIIc chi subunit